MFIKSYIIVEFCLIEILNTGDLSLYKTVSVLLDVMGKVKFLMCVVVTKIN